MFLVITLFCPFLIQRLGYAMEESPPPTHNFPNLGKYGVWSQDFGTKPKDYNFNSYSILVK